VDINSADEIMPDFQTTTPLEARRVDPSNGPISVQGAAANAFPSMTAVQLYAGGARDRQFLTMAGGNQFTFRNQANSLDSAWYLAPVSRDIVRIQQRVRDDWQAIGVGGDFDRRLEMDRFGFNRNGGRFRGGRNSLSNGVSQALSMMPLGNAASQLWRIQSGNGGGYCLESVMYPGMGLTCVPNQGLFLQPMSFDPWQTWYSQLPSFPLPQPQFRSVQHQVVPNPPLTPAAVQLVNNHSEAVMVLLADRRNPQQPQKLKIASGRAEAVQLERDPGATIVETVETTDAFGNWRQQQYTTPIPSSVLYDVSVYEEFLQSIAIDRTGTSPNPIEDINYQPRSVGFFLVPPGSTLPDIAELDVHEIATEAQNPGAVRRMSQRDLERNNKSTNGIAPSADPLKEILNKFQSQRGAF
jgi:hypothetical protein